MPSNRPSFERVDYSVRPAKSIERKMLAEMFTRLRVFRPVESYAYVGLGSTFFTDFILFHRLLGFTHMVSIERETDHSERIEFNRPYDCIDLQFGETTDVLPRLDWSDPAIVWLDYDDRLSRRKMTDVVYLSQNLPSSSLLLLTLPSYPRRFQAGSPPDLQRRLDILRNDLQELMPDSLKPIDVADLPQAQRKIANTVIANALASRNAAVPDDEKVTYRQTLFFRYADGAEMVTFGGLLLTQADIELLEKARLGDMPFYRPGEDYYRLRPPKLTIKERHYLDKQLPNGIVGCPGVPEEFVEEYARIYRYFPFFVEAEV